MENGTYQINNAQAGVFQAASQTLANKISLEEKYFETRNRYIQKLQKSWNQGNHNESPALAKLEKELEAQMKMIVGPVSVEGFPKQGRLNLLMRAYEAGFDVVDGLRFDAERESLFYPLFVTTDSILKRYLAEQPELPKNLSELSRTGNFYSNALSQDAAVTHFAKVPVQVANSESFAYAFLGLTAQNIGPFVPGDVFVFVKKGSRIIIVSSPSQTKINQIQTCENEWKKFEKKSRFDKGFNAYVTCFGREAKKQQFFPKLIRQAQSIVDRLQKD